METTDSLEVVVSSFMLAMNLACSSLACIFWDHFLTLDDEIKYIWKRPRWDLVKVFFLFTRYSTAAGLLFVAYITNGNDGFTDTMCKASVMTAHTFAVFCMGSTNAFLNLRLYSMWDRRPRALLALWVAFVVTSLGLFVSNVMTEIEIEESTISLLGGSCFVTDPPHSIIGIWLSLLAFNLFAMILVITNVFKERYRHLSPTIIRLRREICLYFIGVTAAGLANLIVYFAGRLSVAFGLAFVVWGLHSIALARLVLNVEAVKAKAMTQACVIMGDFDETVTSGTGLSASRVQTVMV